MNYQGNLFISTIQNENCFTELFTNLLKYDDFRKEILSLIIDDKQLIENIEYEHFTTQQRLENIGQPDIRLSNDDIDIIFEIKVSTGRDLTIKQQNNYIQHLTDKTKLNQVVFIVPHNYNCSKISQLETKIISWKTITNKLQNLTISNPLNNNNIPAIIRDEYLIFLNDWFSVITFNPNTLNNMNNKEIPRAIENFYLLIDKVKKELPLLNPTVSLSTSITKNDYGVSIKINDCLISFGLWFYFWKETSFPLSISIDAKNGRLKKKEIIQFFKSRNLAEPKEFQNKEAKGELWYSTQITDEILTSNDNSNVIASLLIDLEQIMKK